MEGRLVVTSRKHLSWLAGICMAGFPLLAPAPASALSFSFSFTDSGQTITGLITGLDDNSDFQTDPPVSVSITSGPAQTLGTYTFEASGLLGDAGFSTSNGDLILKEIPANEFPSRFIIWTGILPSPTLGDPPLGVLRFGRATFVEELAPLRFGRVTGVWAPVLPTRRNPLPEGLIDGLVRFEAVADPTPAEVPGPLPLLGAAAAFGYSRKLRHRIQQQKQVQQKSQIPRQY
jgi:hypothetical protein